jgi:predicted ATPase
VLVGGYHRPPGSILIVEQPEIHLHPKAQAEVGTFLAGVVDRGVQVFAETHSEHLLLRIQSHVAAGDLAADDVNVFSVFSDEETKRKICLRIPVGEDGFFTEEWPRGFFPERLAEARRLSMLAHQHSAGGDRHV